MIRFRSLATGVALMALLATSVAFAQGPRGGGPFGGRGARGPSGSGFALQALNLTDTQREQVKEIRERYREQGRALSQRLREAGRLEASARHRRLLEYLVEETLAGRADRLKGLTIAIDVFGRDAATYDREADPVVRIEAAKLRRRLKSYYQTAGQEDPIRIDLPKGTYLPLLERREYPSLEFAGRAGR